MKLLKNKFVIILLGLIVMVGIGFATVMVLRYSLTNQQSDLAPTPQETIVPIETYENAPDGSLRYRSPGQ